MNNAEKDIREKMWKQIPDLWNAKFELEMHRDHLLVRKDYTKALLIDQKIKMLERTIEIISWYC